MVRRGRISRAAYASSGNIPPSGYAARSRCTSLQHRPNLRRNEERRSVRREFLCAIATPQLQITGLPGDTKYKNHDRLIQKLAKAENIDPIFESIITSLLMKCFGSSVAHAGSITRRPQSGTRMAACSNYHRSRRAGGQRAADCGTGQADSRSRLAAIANCFRSTYRCHHVVRCGRLDRGRRHTPADCCRVAEPECVT
jgi:hypothetical protein